MPYSLDLRTKVIDFVERGGGITRAAIIFGVGRASIYRWLNRDHLSATVVERRHRKLDWKAVEKDVRENPELRLVERAVKFGVQPASILYALRRMKITRKKTTSLPRKKSARKNRILQNVTRINQNIW
jgi:transposase